MVALASAYIALSSATTPTSTATNPIVTIRRGEVVGRSLGTPAAARSIVTESGVILSPVSIAESPSATERNNGTTKNSPIITTNWKKNMRSPPFRPPRSAMGWTAAPR
jgi:hypothetical protein